jgi:virginiamycin B lyase
MFPGALLVCVGALVLAARAGAVTITEFPTDSGQLPRYIHVGPDQNLWYTEVGPTSGAIGRISTAGEHFASIDESHKPVDLVTMPDGTVVWTTDNGNLGRRFPAGAVQPTSARVGQGYAIAVTASGDLRWGVVARFSPAHVYGQVCRLTGDFQALVSLCAVDPSATSTRITGLALGSDGRLWTAAYEGNSIGRMTAAGDAFDLKVDLPVGSGPSRLALGPDGNLWVTMYDASAIDRIAPNGARMRFPLAPGLGPNDIVEGPDGALWFTELKGNAIGRMTPTGQVQEFALAPGSQPEGITSGPDGAIWFTDSGTAKIGRLRMGSGVGAGGSNGGGDVSDRVAPRFTTRVAFSPRRFRVTRAATPTRARKPAPNGSSLTYSLSEPATVAIVIARARSGRRVGGSCKAPTRSNRHHHPCTRYVTVGTLQRRALQGLNKVAFTGRIGRKALQPGAYRATATATDAARNVSKHSTATFTIVK